MGVVLVNDSLETPIEEIVDRAKKQLPWSENP
jgi:hypothetical protein